MIALYMAQRDTVVELCDKYLGGTAWQEEHSAGKRC